jgi:surface polysaccharide O-acyltransferase-like enzyme
MMKPILCKRVVDFLLYISISLLITGAFIAMAISGLSKINFLRWDFLLFVSFGVFGLFIERNRTQWKSNLFWITTLICFTVHLTVWSVALWHMRDMDHPGWWLRIIVPLELAFFVGCWNLLTRNVRREK